MREDERIIHYEHARKRQLNPQQRVPREQEFVYSRVICITRIKKRGYLRGIIASLKNCHLDFDARSSAPMRFVGDVSTSPDTFHRASCSSATPSSWSSRPTVMIITLLSCFESPGYRIMIQCVYRPSGVAWSSVHITPSNIQAPGIGPWRFRC